nr:MAG TPA: tail tape measure protein [Caudoviricetes sp.]
MSDGKLEIKVVVDGLDMDKLNKKLKELKSELSKPAKGAGFDEFKKELADVTEKSTKTKTKVKDLKEEVSQPTKSKGLDNVKDDLAKTGKEADTTKTKVKGLNDELQKPIPDNTNGLPDKFKKTGDEADKGKSKVKDFFLAFSAVRIAEKAIGILSSSLDGAIKRFDTLNSYPRVLKLMGYSTEEVAKSTKQLSDGIDGLPTRLDEVVSTAKQFTTITKDIKFATKLTIALNNAFLASGSSSEDAARGLLQFQQMLSSGKPDMQSWKTLQETMPIALTKTAEAFGFTGKSAKTQFYNALKEGKITFDQFGKKLIELNKGVGGFEELAKESSRGIGTSLKNLANSSVKGLASMIQAFDDLSKAVTGKNIDQHIDSLKNLINGSFNTMNGIIRGSIPTFKEIGRVFGEIYRFIQPLEPAFAGLLASILTFKSVNLVVDILGKFGFTAVNLNGIILGLTTKIIQAGGVIPALGTAISGLIGTINTVINATNGWTLALTTVVGGLTAMYLWLNRESEASKNYKAGLEESKKATDSMITSIDDVIDKQKELTEVSKASADGNRKLADEIFALAGKENRTAAETVLLKKHIETLNGNVDGLNLKFDKNTKLLSMNKDQILQRINAGSGNQKLIDLEKALQDSYDTTGKAQSRLLELKEKITQIQNDENLSMKEAFDLIKPLGDEYDKLSGKLPELEQAQESLKQEMVSASQEIATAVSNGANEQVITYQSLTQNQQQAVDQMNSKYNELKDSASNMFDRIQQKAVISTQDVIANMQANTEAVRVMGDNIQVLMQRGVDQGLIEKLRQAGPESAQQIQALASSTDAELQQLNTTYQNAGDTAKKALLQSLNIPEGELAPQIEGMITASKSSLMSAVESADFGSIGKKMTTDIAGSITENATAPTEAVSTVATDTKTAFDTAIGNSMTEAGTKITTDLSGGINSGAGEVGTAMDGVKGKAEAGMNETVSVVQVKAKEIPNKIRDIYGSMVSSGQYAMSGLSSGMSNGAGQVYAMAETIASNIRSKIKSALDIHSPSRVMRDEVGRFIPEGLAVGIDKYSNTVDKPIQRMKERIANFDFSADNLINRGRRVFENGLNAFSSNQYLQMEIANGGFTVEVPVTVGEREIAKVIAPIVRSENKRVERLERFTRGEK